MVLKISRLDLAKDAAVAAALGYGLAYALIYFQAAYALYLGAVLVGSMVTGILGILDGKNQTPADAFKDLICGIAAAYAAGVILDTYGTLEIQAYVIGIITVVLVFERLYELDLKKARA